MKLVAGIRNAVHVITNLGITIYFLGITQNPVI
jgi:hypothetical protein